MIALGVYTLSLAPGLSWAHDSADGGELAAAAFALGIPHPPGYPVYVLLAHLFTRLPIGEVATRTNFFSACCAAGAAVLATFALRAQTRPVTSLAGGLALAFAPLLWSQAVVTEVHALNALFAGAQVALAVQAAKAATWSAARRRVFALGVGLLWGLSLGNHLTALFLLPLVALTLRSGRATRYGLLGVALGLLPYLYLPLRAWQSPPINWGNPRTLDALLWVVSARMYRQFLFALPIAHLPSRLLAWSGLLTQQFTWFGLIVVVLGGIALWQADRYFWAATVSTVVLCVAFAVGYNTSDSYLYLIPALVVLTVWAGVGVDQLVDALQARWAWANHVAAVLLIGLLTVAAISRYPALDLSGERTADEFRSAVLDSAPSRAVILARQDAHTFSLWYWQIATGARPDVLVLDTDLLAFDWYVGSLPDGQAVARDLRSSEEALRDIPSAVLAERWGRPFCTIQEADDALACTSR